MNEERFDFFVSHAGSDLRWAKWVAWQLDAAGYKVILDDWHFPPGSSIVTKMNEALEHCDRIVALYSTAYFENSRYTWDEFIAALRNIEHDGQGVQKRLIPIRIEDVPIDAIPLVARDVKFADIFGMPDEEQAREVLLAAVDGRAWRPDKEPPLPVSEPSPGRKPPSPVPLDVWNVPPRNPGFVGRDDLLSELREWLATGVPQVLHGMGGMGKTQIAIEYAHLFASEYDRVWWVRAEQPALIGPQLAKLARALGIKAMDEADQLPVAAFRQLRRLSRWLLVFDNAVSPQDIEDWLPGGSGHVLITSRESGWSDTGRQCQVKVLRRDESVAILRARVRGLTEFDANGLAEDLGDLPLALAQAANFIAATGMHVSTYRRALKDQAAQIMAEGAPRNIPPLTAAIKFHFGKLALADPAAAELAGLCSFLAPDRGPDDLLSKHRDKLPPPLAQRAADPVGWSRAVENLTRHSLAGIEYDEEAGRNELRMHRTTQAILRDIMGTDQAALAWDRIGQIVAASCPGQPDDPATWPAWASLMPHLLAFVDRELDLSPALRSELCDASAYLLAHGEARNGLDLISRLHEKWSAELGEDADQTMMIANCLAKAHCDVGDWPAGRRLAQTSLDRRRYLLGEKHLQTLTAASDLASNLHGLGKVQEALDLDQVTFDLRQSVLGRDHRDTLLSASNLARDLGTSGYLEAAIKLNQDTYVRRQKTLGDNHPQTLDSASNLVSDLCQMGERQRESGDPVAAQQSFERALGLAETTVALRRTVQGPDHPATLQSSTILLANLSNLRKFEEAGRLAEDALKRLKVVRGDDDLITLVCAANLAGIMHEQGDTESARDLAAETLAQMQRYYSNHPATLACADDLEQYERALLGLNYLDSGSI